MLRLDIRSLVQISSGHDMVCILKDLAVVAADMASIETNNSTLFHIQTSAIAKDFQTVLGTLLSSLLFQAR